MFWSHICSILSRFATFAIIVTFMTWIWLAVGAAMTFIVRTDHGYPKTFRGFLRFFFPIEIVRHQSCRVDAFYYVVNKINRSLLLAPLYVGSVISSNLVYQGLTDLFGPHAQRPESTVVWIGVAIAATIGADFATFYTHYLDHKIPVLWEFHKVHHSSAFLIPVTNYRFHPVQDLFDNAGQVLTTGVLLGVFSYLFSMPIYENTIIGIDAYYLVNALSFHHIRHSHINMSYGWLENWLVSPAQHQLHHSQELRHWDKNFGLFLSVWDRWFGTMLYSEPLGSFRLGLPENEGQRYRSVWQLYTTPLVNIWKMSKREVITEPPPQQANTTTEATP